MSLPPLPKNSELEKALGCSVVHYKDALKYGQACREQALEEAAVCAWSHYMDTCKANNIAPASSERWLASKIRSLK